MPGVSYPPSTGVGGGGAPTDAQYVVGATNGDLSAERVVTATSTVGWDLATAGQAKAGVVAGSIGPTQLANIATETLLGRSTAGTGAVEGIAIGDGLTLAAGVLSAEAGEGTFAGGSCEVTVDFGHASGGEGTLARATVTGQSWVTPTTRIVATVFGETDDHDLEDAAVEGLVVTIGNVVDGVGFDVIVAAPRGTWGQYTVHCVGV